MAGQYPDAPSRRMAWDADGSIFLYSLSTTARSFGQGPAGTWTEGSVANRESINNESISIASPNPANSVKPLWCIIFPEEREVDGFFDDAQTADTFGNSWWAASDDTTNGIDGSWATLIGGKTNPSSRHGPLEDYRDDIESAALAGQTSVKWYYQSTSGAFPNFDLYRTHLYGEISPGETPDRILFLDTENGDAEFTKVLDFGDIPRGQTTTRTFKIINNSASKTINTIQVTAEDLYLNAGGWYEFGDDGISYQATFSVGNLSNGAEETIFLKQVVPDGETFGVQAGRIKVSHDDVT